MAWGNINWLSGGSNSPGGLANFNIFNPSSPADCCAPVYIRDYNGNTIAIVESGGTYDINPVTFVRTITFKAGSAYSVSFVSLGSGNISVLSSTNITSAVYTNRTIPAVVVPPYHVTHNDVVTITVVPTNPAIDSVLVLQGVFDSVTISVTDPNLGGNGQKMYTLNQAAAPATVSVNDLGVVGYPLLATVVLTAGVSYGSLAYRAIDNSVYVFGQNGVNSMVVSRIDTATDTVVATTTFAGITNFGFGFPIGVYNYTDDIFHVISQGGATCSLVKYMPATNTASFIVSINFMAWTNGYYMGFADYFENSFAFSGAIPAVVYKETLPAVSYNTLQSFGRNGNTGQLFNRVNRKYYVTEFNGGIYEYDPGKEPFTRLVTTVVGIFRGSICHDYTRNQIFGTATTSRNFGWTDLVVIPVSGTVAVAAVGAETAFKSIEYSDYADKVFMSSRAGNIVRVIDPATRLLDATTPTVTVGAQDTGTTTGFRSICFNRVKLF